MSSLDGIVSLLDAIISLLDGIVSRLDTITRLLVGIVGFPFAINSLIEFEVFYGWGVVG